jgi:glucokinase
MNLYVDYGGTNFRYQMNDEAVQSNNSQSVDLVNFLENMIVSKGIKKIAISFAGQVNNGKIISAPNISLHNLDIKEYIWSKYKVQLEIENDLKCATLFESSLQKEAKNMVVVYIGTGVGCGLIVNHQLISGKNNFAGELGHIPFKATPFRCGCSRNDCLELSLSGKALKLWSEYYHLETKEQSLQAIQNNPLGKPITEAFEKALEHLFFTLLNLYDPELFVFGGGVIQNNPELIKNLKKSYEQSAFHAVRQAPKIILSSSTNGPLEGAKILLHNKGDIQ